MIYILEDDPSISKLLEYTLSTGGYEVAAYNTPSSFWKAFGARVPDLVLLDIMLPEQSGLEVLKTIRSSYPAFDVRVIMLTAKGTEYDKVVGLDLGADDYITKPFGMMELLARIKAVLRRGVGTGGAKDGCVIEIGDIRLDEREHSVSVNGHELSMTLKEYELLRLLMHNEGACISRDDILQKVWGYAYIGETRTVDVHIRRIREKLGPSGAMIQTVSGVGYKLKNEIE